MGREVTGEFIVGACWSNNDDYVLWAMDNILGTMYMPSWQQTSKIVAGQTLTKILLTNNKKYLLMLFAGQLVTVEPDL